ncbi:zinc ribbon domain-containing protein [Acidithiobacillus ferrooxidans]|uniref:zinc ribbon domain-containing protein n=1 Tax=Acidithiobacillus ferrooxidans TaxID=920 RepID=UPI0013D4E28B|nr:zinc ribbon domain-containing protein [Acidithiobacillus ferrooxidans]
MMRTYPYSHAANAVKERQVWAVLRAYRHSAQQIANDQWKSLFITGGMEKDGPICPADHIISKRYRQTCQYQVIAVLKSWLSNRKNDFRMLVTHSSLWKDQTEEGKRLCIQLLFINKHGLWFRDRVVMRKEAIPPEVMRLARNLFRRLMNKHNKPSFRHIGMALDAKVARVEAPKKAHSAQFPYWLTVSTLDSGKPIHIPLVENPYALGADGDDKAFVQINVRRGTAMDGRAGILDIARVKEAAPVFSLERPRPQIVETLGIDVGLRTLVATSMGELLGRNLIDRLCRLDAQISRLAAERQRQGLPVRSRRYDTLVNRLRTFLKNEIGRVLNGLFARVHPAKVVIESLDFRSPDLSRRLNRLVQNFGRTWFRKKLDMLSEQYGFLVEEVHAAYSSQTCKSCDYVAKNNRSSQSKFHCRFCGRKAHADPNGACVIRRRRSLAEYAPWRSKRQILQATVGCFLKRWSGRLSGLQVNSALRLVVEGNPYFADHRAALWPGNTTTD